MAETPKKPDAGQGSTELPVAILSDADRSVMESFRLRHATQMLVIVFTDLVGSTALRSALGDEQAEILETEHRNLLLCALGQVANAQTIKAEGDSCLFVFLKPGDAVRFAIRAGLLHREARLSHPRLPEYRTGIHLGTVIVEEGSHGPARQGGIADIKGLQVDTAARIMSMAAAGQILCSRALFDDARQTLKGADIQGVGVLGWRSHGYYALKGRDEPLEICEVGEEATAPFAKPTGHGKGRPADFGEEIPGWRPGLDVTLPETNWVLEEKLGEGGFGEVWLAHDRTQVSRKTVFKFCTKKSRVRSLRRELDIFNHLTASSGKTPPGVVQVIGAHDSEPPYYIQLEYVVGRDLRQWLAAYGKDAPLRIRLDLAAQMARVLARIHLAGVVHRDVKPSNFLVDPSDDPGRAPTLKLCDLGIGQEAMNAALHQPDRQESLAGGGARYTMHTQTLSEAAGAYFFIAPELVVSHSSTPGRVAKRAQAAADIYSLGVTLYQLFAGDPDTVPTPGLRGVADPILREDIAECLDEHPEERPTAEQICDRLLHYDERKAALEATQRKERGRRTQRARMVAGTVVVLLGVAGMGIWIGLTQHRKAADAERNATKSSRTSIEKVISTPASSGQYEAAVEGALELRAKFGPQALSDPDVQRLLRVAIWQNPKKSQWQLPAGGPDAGDLLGIASCGSLDESREMYFVRSNSVWLWNVDKAEVSVQATLPDPIRYLQAVSLSKVGDVYAGAGSRIYLLKRGDKDFRRVLDLRETTIPEMKEYGPPDKVRTSREWMENTGRTFPITGLAVDGKGERAIVVLGDVVFCYLDLANGTCLGWNYGVGDYRVSSPHPFVRCAYQPTPRSVGSLVQVSDNLEWGLYGSDPPRGAFLWFFQLPGLDLVHLLQNRDTPIIAAGFREVTINGWMSYCITEQGIICEVTLSNLVPQTASNPNDYFVRSVLSGPIVQAGFDADRRVTYLLNRGGILHSEYAMARHGLVLDRSIPVRSWVGGHLGTDGTLTLLDQPGVCYRYDTRAFGNRQIACDYRLLRIARGSNRSRYFALLASDPVAKQGRLAELDVNEGMNVSTPTFVADGDPPATYEDLAVQPGGKRVAGIRGSEVTVHEFPPIRKPFHFTVERGTVSKVGFSGDGLRMFVGGSQGDLYVLSTPDWKCEKISQAAGGITDGLLGGSSNGVIVFCCNDPARSVRAIDLQTRADLWTLPTNIRSAEALVPWRQGKGAQRFWVRADGGEYHAVSLGEAGLLHVQDVWRGRKPHGETCAPGSDLMALIADGGTFHICRESNLESFLDGQKLGIQADQVEFNSDGARLAVLSNGRLFLVETEKWRWNKVLAKNVEYLLGEPPVK